MGKREGPLPGNVLSQPERPAPGGLITDSCPSGTAGRAERTRSLCWEGWGRRPPSARTEVLCLPGGSQGRWLGRGGTPTSAAHLTPPSARQPVSCLPPTPGIPSHPSYLQMGTLRPKGPGVCPEHTVNRGEGVGQSSFAPPTLIGHCFLLVPLPPPPNQAAQERYMQSWGGCAQGCCPAPQPWEPLCSSPGAGEQTVAGCRHTWLRDSLWAAAVQGHWPHPLSGHSVTAGSR